MSFETTACAAYPVPTNWTLPQPVQPVGGEASNEGYSIIPMELDLDQWQNGNQVAYHNPDTGVTISFFPVIHTRKGSIG